LFGGAHWTGRRSRRQAGFAGEMPGVFEQTRIGRPAAGQAAIFSLEVRKRPMIFHSPEFLVFLLALLVPFYLFRKIRIPLLVVANAVFYGASGLGLLLLFMAVTLVTFLCGLGLKRWRPLFWIGLAANAGNLLFFKYTLMIMDTAERIAGHPLLLTDLAREWVTDGSGELILPIGISFYTFQLMAYLIDVWRGQLEPSRNLLKFWVFISVFPQLIAGPIMRGSELMPQVDGLKDRRVRWDEIRYGFYLIFIGLIKKTVFADNLEKLVNPRFADISALTPEEAWVAACLFGFQIYFDFSAYSDMALGLGHLLGLKLVENFRTPYLSGSPREFWDRWHISLSRWIRDYIYIGLGGNRKGALRTQFNLLAAMLISGLWHGAAWHFVAWGAVHGVLLVVHRWTLALNRIGWIKRLRAALPYRVLAVAVFFPIVTWTWVFFRAGTLGGAWEMTKLMARADPAALAAHPLFALLAGLYALHIFEWFIREREALAGRIWHFVPAVVRGAAYAALILLIFFNMKGETYEFIYFQF
jgi:alginate O-acetyltransferase complex protein AlgI